METSAQSANIMNWRLLLLLGTWLLVAKVVVTVGVSFRDYLPPNFENGFLQGRQDYFYGDGYHYPFYVHVVSGPLSLILGSFLMSQALRRTRWHRAIGKTQFAVVLLLVVPSGLWMAWYSDGGPIAASGFAALALATGLSCWMGWRHAIRRQYKTHLHWMLRCFVLLCSAVVLRMMGGLATIAGWSGDWTYPLSAWACWIVPLVILELIFANVYRGCKSEELANM